MKLRSTKPRFVKGSDHEMTAAQAEELMGITQLPRSYRIMALEKYVASHGRYGLVELFADFIGLANSVVANSSDFTELFLITEANLVPTQAEKINLPTIFGALNGVTIAQKNTHGMCQGCAYRQGTAANQSPITTSDAKWVFEEIGQKFMCHEKPDKDGECGTLCAGFARRNRELARAEEQVEK